MRILLIEDEHKLAQAIKRALELQKYAVDVAADGTSGLNLALAEAAYDVIISDVMLPGLDGVEVCRQLRLQGQQTPVLMLTARGQVDDKVTGLDAGADDYMVKPFAFEELFARVRSLVRRPQGRREPVLTAGDLTLDPIQFRVTRAGETIPLSTREFSLLEYLLRHRNTVISKEQIIAHVWNYDADILPGTVEVHIKNIRDKVDKPFETKLIHTVRGFGYELKVPSHHTQKVSHQTPSSRSKT